MLENGQVFACMCPGRNCMEMVHKRMSSKALFRDGSLRDIAPQYRASAHMHRLAHIQTCCSAAFMNFIDAGVPVGADGSTQENKAALKRPVNSGIDLLAEAAHREYAPNVLRLPYCAFCSISITSASQGKLIRLMCALHFCEHHVNPLRSPLGSDTSFSRALS